MNKMMIAALALALGAAACTPKQATENNNEAPVEEQTVCKNEVKLSGDWKVTSVAGIEVPALVDAHILFNAEDNTYSAYTGVNTINGGFTLADGKLNFGEGAMTKMMGEPAAMLIEDTFVQVLNGECKFVEVEGDTLTLKQGDTVVMTLQAVK